MSQDSDNNKTDNNKTDNNKTDNNKTDNNKTDKSVIDTLASRIKEEASTISQTVKQKVTDSELVDSLTDKILPNKEEVAPGDRSEFSKKIYKTKQEIANQANHLRRKTESIFHPNFVTMELGDIQSMVLQDRPAPYYGTLVALKINNGDVGRQLLKTVLPNVTDSEYWHQTNDEDMQATLNVMFTYEGLQALGVPEDSLDTFPDNFKAGMVGRAEILHDVGDNAPENWEAPFGENGDIHVWGMVVANTQAKWQAKFQELKADIDPHIKRDEPHKGHLELLIEQDFGADDAVKNVVGFRDNISNPEVAGSGIKRGPAEDKPIAAGEFVMGYKGEAGTVAPMPQPEILGKNGSFMVVRKYQSHVVAFNKYCIEHTDSMEEANLLAAKMFGRWRSGAALSLTPEHDDEALGADPERNNNFDYTNDQVGKGCPFGAHARRMNPRNTKDFILSDVRLHRISRRSVTYGEGVPPDVTVDDGKKRGLYFIGINAHAMDTLEFLQSQWVDDGNFMRLGVERDPMIGVHEGNKDSDTDTFTVPADPIRKRYNGIFQFNTLLGGEYLFIPSLSALQWISELPESANRTPY